MASPSRPRRTGPALVPPQGPVQPPTVTTTFPMEIPQQLLNWGFVPILEPGRCLRFRVSREAAQNVMARSHRNRRRSSNHTRTLTQIIEQNAWVWGVPDPAAFTESWNLINMQHRFQALANSENPVAFIEVFVLWGIPDDPKVFAAMCDNKTRRPRDYFESNKYPHATIALAVSKGMVAEESHKLPQWPEKGWLCTTEVAEMKYLSKRTAIDGAIHDVMEFKSLFKKAYGVWALTWLRLGEINLSDRNEFFEKLTGDARLSQTSSVYHLRQKLDELNDGFVKIPKSRLLRYILTAWARRKQSVSAARYDVGFFAN